MGWAIGWDSMWKRDIGYGVPAYCDHPGCRTRIDRGLDHVCAGGEPYGGERGCGLYFCAKHLHYGRPGGPFCGRCNRYKSPYKRIAPEHPVWIRHKLTDESWAEWRAENPQWVAQYGGRRRWRCN